MKRVCCEVHHDPPRSYGDCFRACLASLLEVPASAVPHFLATDDDRWWQDACAWATDHGLELHTSDNSVPWGHIAILERGHAVVMLGDKLVLLDPSRTPKPLGKVAGRVHLRYLDPRKFLEWHYAISKSPSCAPAGAQPDNDQRGGVP